MAKDPESRCRCGSRRRYRRCCGGLHAGGIASSPEALMRSRYCAYALGEVDYVIATQVASVDRDDVRRFCDETRFEGLRVLSTTEDGDVGTVTFRATLHRGGVDVSFAERSRFRRIAGQWRYVDGDAVQ